MKRIKESAFFVVIALATLAAAPGGSGAEQRQTQELAVEASGARTIRVATRNGAVRLRGSDTDRIEGQAVKAASARSDSEARRLMDQVRVETRRDGDEVVVEAIWPPRPSRQLQQVRVSLELTVPRGLAVVGTTSNGAMDASDVARATLNTSNGAIQARRIAGELDAHTSNGAVNAEDVAGSARLVTSNGAIRANRIGGGLQAVTSRGAIHADLDPQTRPKVELVTSNGAIHAAIAGAASARLTAATSKGRVQVQPGDGVRYNKPHTQAEATFGGGEGTIALRTSNGSIELVRR